MYINIIISIYSDVTLKRVQDLRLHWNGWLRSYWYVSMPETSVDLAPTQFASRLELSMIPLCGGGTVVIICFLLILRHWSKTHGAYGDQLVQYSVWPVYIGTLRHTKLLITHIHVSPHTQLLPPTPGSGPCAAAGPVQLTPQTWLWTILQWKKPGQCTRQTRSTRSSLLHTVTFERTGTSF